MEPGELGQPRHPVEPDARQIHRLDQLEQTAITPGPSAATTLARFLLWRFPFTIYYSQKETTITIWAVAHGSRRPEYWANRL